MKTQDSVFMKERQRKSTESSSSRASYTSSSLSSLFDDNIHTVQGNHVRVPSLVAKLMGLETLPDSALCSRTNSMSYEDKDLVRISGSFEKTGSSSLFSNEPAPWEKVDRGRIHRKMASTKVPYSEIDKRLKDLEFLLSGKDLSAIKQMMEATQGVDRQWSFGQGQGSNFRSHRDSERRLESSVRSVENQKSFADQLLSSKEDNSGSSTNDESTTAAIVKPPNLVNGSYGLRKDKVGESIDRTKGSSSGRTDKDPNFSSDGKRVSTVHSVGVKHDRFTKTTQCSIRQQKMSEDGNIGSGKSQQKKHDIGKRSRPPTLPNSIMSKTWSNEKQPEPKSSPGRRRRRIRWKNRDFQDRLSDSSVDSSNSCYDELEDTAQSSEIFRHCSYAINSTRSSSASSFQSACMDASESIISGSVKKVSILQKRVEESSEHVFVPQAYSNSVSVPDNINKYKDSSSAPKKHALKITKAACKSKDVNSDLAQQSSEDSVVLTSESGSKFEINRKKLKNIDSLVQKLRSLNSGHDETRVDYIASLCENSNPEQRYVSEILLASGLLLRDFTSSSTDYQFHTSGYPLNPQLFLVLEQTNASSSSNHECPSKKTGQTSEKIHRKLIFDTVNEILARKLSSVGPNSDTWSRPVKQTRMSLNAQKLLKETCSEINGLQIKSSRCRSNEEDAKWETILFDDVMHHTESWINFNVGIKDAVLDIERLIFKDLVKEIVIGEISAWLNSPLFISHRY